jgi:NADPH-dependent glutamate synthase beta subunit-like oxidoreductase
MTEGCYDAVFLAIGAHLAKRAYIPAGDASRILDAVALLRGMETGEQPQLGRKVIIYGGGNTPSTRPAPPNAWAQRMQ